MKIDWLCSFMYATYFSSVLFFYKRYLYSFNDSA